MFSLLKTKNEKYVILKTKFAVLIGLLTNKFAEVLTQKAHKNRLATKTTLLIESGLLGWNSVFYEELKRSAGEYLNEANVVRSTIDREKGYLRQSLGNISRIRPTHFCLDPRTGSQKKYKALIETLILSFFLRFHKITPIFILTDGAVRVWRYQAFMATASKGVIVTFVDQKEMGPRFVHNRIISPIFMPISLQTLDRLDILEEIEVTSDIGSNQIFFLGSLYSSRRGFFTQLNEELKIIGSTAKAYVEEKSSDSSSRDYWNRISKYNSLITTTFQQRDPRYIMDRLWINQMVFRISEVLAAGKLLYSTEVPGMSKYFESGIHFVSYLNVRHAAAMIDYYEKNPKLGSKIADAGRSRYRELAETKVFWSTIDSFLEIHMVSTE